jgi:hypothetical protein
MNDTRIAMYSPRTMAGYRCEWYEAKRQRRCDCGCGKPIVHGAGYYSCHRPGMSRPSRILLFCFYRWIAERQSEQARAIAGRDRIFNEVVTAHLSSRNDKAPDNRGHRRVVFQEAVLLVEA